VDDGRRSHGQLLEELLFGGLDVAGQFLLPLVEDLPALAGAGLLDLLLELLLGLAGGVLLGQDLHPAQAVVGLVLEHVLDRVVDQAEASAAAAPEVGLEPEAAHERRVRLVLL
jgi:hypothetical protein